MTSRVSRMVLLILAHSLRGLWPWERPLPREGRRWYRRRWRRRRRQGRRGQGWRRGMDWRGIEYRAGLFKRELCSTKTRNTWQIGTPRSKVSKSFEGMQPTAVQNPRALPSGWRGSKVNFFRPANHKSPTCWCSRSNSKLSTKEVMARRNGWIKRLLRCRTVIIKPFKCRIRCRIVMGE